MQGRVAVVTGGSTGIGLSTAQKLAEKGAQVVLFARTEGDLTQAQKEVSGASVVVGDVSQEADVKRLFFEVQKQHGHVDALFVNAGVAEFVALEDAEEAHYQRLFDVNVKGAFFTMKHAAPLLSRGSSVVFTSSVAAEIGAPLCSLYGATKGAVTAFARNVAAELLQREIRVNVVSPGPTETAIQGKAPLSEAEMGRIAPYLMTRMRLGRLGQASEVASLVTFLLSEESSFIVGQCIAADGGMTGL